MPLHKVHKLNFLGGKNSRSANITPQTPIRNKELMYNENCLIAAAKASLLGIREILF
jgi:hypothetical protein